MDRLESEEVKNAVIARLLEIFPTMAVYKEAMTKPKYPHFFVYILGLTDEEERKDCHILSYSMTIRYRVASDPSTDLKLEADLDKVSFKLMEQLNIIDFGNDKIRCTDKRMEKVDGVLHFFCTLDVFVKAVQNDVDTVKQGKLSLEVELNGDKV